jgi:propionyl-CoA synthetase
MAFYAEIHARSRRDPEGFWGEIAQGIDWIKPFDRVLDSNAKPVARWFPGGELNTCWNAIDRHVAAGHADRVAVIYDSPVTNTVAKFTYKQMQTKIAAFAGVLKANGVAKGDRVIVYMPMVPEALVAMLACARLGAVHSVVFGGFAANELAVRIDDCTPKAIVSASCGIEGAKVVPYKPLLDSAIAIARHKPSVCVILQRPQLAWPRKPRPPIACRWRPPIRFTFSTRPAPRARPRAWCATMAATRWRCIIR